MATTADPADTTVIHPRATAFTAATGDDERRLGLLCAGTGIALICVVGLLGLVMRLTQAEVIDLSPAWFYRLLTLHGSGMIGGGLLAGMGVVWYVLRPTVPLRPERLVAAWAAIVAGAVAIAVATLVGGFGAAWTYLPPLSYFPAGQWSGWSQTSFLVGMVLVGAGFFVFCLDVIEQTTRVYGGLAGTLGIRFLRDQDAVPPPPQVIAATVVAIDGALAAAAGTAITLGLLTRTYDSGVGIDPLVAKNEIYFFGHTTANLLMYLAVCGVYVILPRYAGRAYEVTKVFVVGWLVAFVLILTVFSHHLYMDFVQPRWAEITSSISSYASVMPVAVITIYSQTMLVWGSRYRWTLASTLFYVGLAGWAIGGTGAVIDSVIPFNFRFHNTVWVVAHFHTYLMLTVVLWLLAFVTHLLERDAAQTSPRGVRAATVALLLGGGFGLTGTWFVGGVLGIPRRYAIQPPGTSGYSLAGSIFGLLFALGVLAWLVQIVPLARNARSLRLSRRVEGAAVVVAPPPRPAGLPFETAPQFAAGVAAAVVALGSFFPQVIDASDTSVRFHHLDHAGHFVLGALVGMLLASAPAVSRRLGERASLGLAAVVLAPTAMMLLMVPRIYEPLEGRPVAHALFHVAMAVFGLVTGVGATRLGRLSGRFAAFLSVGMAVLFAAAMT